MDRQRVFKAISLYLAKRQRLNKLKLAAVGLMINVLSSMRANQQLILTAIFNSEVKKVRVWKHDRHSTFYEHDVPAMISDELDVDGVSSMIGGAEVGNGGDATGVSGDSGDGGDDE